MFLERISNFLVKNRKKIFFYSLFAVFIFIALHDISFAWNDAVTKTADVAKNTWWWAGANSDKTDRAEILNTLLASISAIAWVMIYFVTMLLDPWFTSWTIFWIDTKLHDVWVLVSNIVYFIFAFILIWIAFMNIIWKGDKWELKQAMPKFIVWVLIVPFSWFIVSLVVSLSNILTIAALQLPSDSFQSFNEKLNNIELQTDCKLDFNKLSSDTSDTSSWFNCGWEKVKLWDSVKNSAFWLVSAYVYGLIKIDELPNIQKQQLANKVINNLLDMLLFIIFNILFILIFFILIVTLWIVLLVRIIWLWIYMALSPLFWLAYFFWKDWWWDLMKKFNFTEFLWLAMVPVYTMLALSFWFVFLSVTMEWLDSSWWQLKDGNKWNESMFKIDKDTINFKPWITNDKGEDVTFKFKVTWWPFSQLTSKSSDDWKQSFMSWLKWSALWFVWAIFMNIFWVVIFRIAIMAALQSSSITKEIVAPIKQFGDSVWSLVAKAPTYAPVFGGKSAAELWQAASTFKWNVESFYSRKWWSLWSKFSEAAWFTESETRKAIRNFNETYKNVKNPNYNDVKDKIMPTLDILVKAKNKHDFNEAIQSLVSKWVLDKEKAEKINYWDNATNMATNVFNALDQKVKKAWWVLLDSVDDLRLRFWAIKDWTSINSSKWTWDNQITTWLDKEWYIKLKDWWESEWKNIKIKVDKSTFWKWDIASLDANESWAEIISVNFNKTKKDAEEFVGNDLKEAIELYWRLWVNEEWFKKILMKLNFQNADKLAKFVVTKYESQK